MTNKLKAVFALIVFAIVVLTAIHPAYATAALVLLGVATLYLFAPVKWLLVGYFFVLHTEGAIKIWTHYNAVARVVADLVLIAVCARIFLSRGTDPLWKPDLSEKEKRISKIIISLMVLFELWVLVQFFNPWGIGLLPSISALKTYVVPVLIFVVVVYYLRLSELISILKFHAIMACVHSVIALIDWNLGIKFWPVLQPYYLQRATDTFGMGNPKFGLAFYLGSSYRPFGLGHSPGVAGIYSWISTIVSFFFVRTVFEVGTPARKAFWLSFSALNVLLTLATLLACQGRTALITFILMLLISIMAINRFYFALVALCAPIAISFALAILISLASSSKSAIRQSTDEAAGNDAKLAEIFSRFATLSDSEAVAKARHPPFERIYRMFSDHTIMGIGLSRVAGHSGPWAAYAKEEKHFEMRYSWADSTYVFLANELGAGGLISWMLAMAAIIYLASIQRNFYGIIIGFFVFVLTFLQGWGSESAFYQPIAGILWLSIGVLVRLGVSESRNQLGQNWPKISRNELIKVFGDREKVPSA